MQTVNQFDAWCDLHAGVIAFAIFGGIITFFALMNFIVLTPSKPKSYEKDI